MSFETLNELKEWIFNNEFENLEEEIYFFKHVKPQIYSKVIYFNKLFKLETLKLSGIIDLNQEIYETEKNKIINFFKKNIDFSHYMNSNNEVFDQNYFVRGTSNIRFNLDDEFFDVDIRFSVLHDLTISKLIAYEKLSIHLTKEINSIKKIQLHLMNPNSKIALEWSNSKSALIELIYSLYSSKVFNNGNADLKSITTFFEQNFNIDLGDIYRAYIDLRRRRNKTQFLETLSDNLLQKMSDDDIK